MPRRLPVLQVALDRVDRARARARRLRAPASMQRSRAPPSSRWRASTPCSSLSGAKNCTPCARDAMPFRRDERFAGRERFARRRSASARSRRQRTPCSPSASSARNGRLPPCAPWRRVHRRRAAVAEDARRMRRIRASAPRRRVAVGDPRERIVEPRSFERIQSLAQHCFERILPARLRCRAPATGAVRASSPARSSQPSMSLPWPIFACSADNASARAVEIGEPLARVLPRLAGARWRSCSDCTRRLQLRCSAPVPRDRLFPARAAPRPRAPDRRRAPRAPRARRRAARAARRSGERLRGAVAARFRHARSLLGQRDLLLQLGELPQRVRDGRLQRGQRRLRGRLVCGRPLARRKRLFQRALGRGLLGRRSAVSWPASAPIASVSCATCSVEPRLVFARERELLLEPRRLRRSPRRTRPAARAARRRRCSAACAQRLQLALRRRARRPAAPRARRSASRSPRAWRSRARTASCCFA